MGAETNAMLRNGFTNALQPLLTQIAEEKQKLVDERAKVLQEVQSKKRKVLDPPSPERTSPIAGAADDENDPDLMDDSVAAVAPGGVLQPTPPDAPSLQVGGQQAAPTAPPKHETAEEERLRESKAAEAERMHAIREAAIADADKAAIRTNVTANAGNNNGIQATA